ncbi:unnamed protein product [Paramecium primaurelia]|uniref:RING-type domain-containing protein n=1 Tax=Paramecium primaurelia TaxID=5886 RepID=A0A8S1NW69_PARPR|nr:unnamed protein product [Paramecium primaurelia]
MEQFEQEKKSEMVELACETVKKRIKKGQAKKKQTNEQPLENCSICYGEIIDKGIIQTCKHTYCFQCIEIWAKEKQTCPQCRVKFNKIQRVWKQGKAKKQKMYNYRSNEMNFNDGNLISINLIYQQIIAMPQISFMDLGFIEISSDSE